MQGVRPELVHEPDATPLLPQIKKDAAAFFGDAAERHIKLLAAIAADGVERVAGEALVVDAHQHGLPGRDVAHRERDVLGLGVADLRPVAVDRELAVLRRQLCRGHAFDEALLGHAMGDEVLHRDQAKAVAPRETLELRHPRHRSIRVRDLADDPYRGQPGEPAEVDGGLGLPGAYEDAPVTRLERKNVPGLHDIVRFRFGIGQHLDGLRAVGGADPRRNTLARVDAHGESGAEPCFVARDHLR